MELSVEPAKFDWYAASVEMAPAQLVEMAATVLADESPVLVQGQNGYGHGYELRRGGARAAVVFAGGASEFPHIVGTGPDAVQVAGFVRSRKVPHRVARVDVCVDTDTPGAFVFLLDELRRCSGAATAYVIQPDRREDGSTYYVGAKSSEVRARLYEKGRQLASAERPDWVRYELQARPQKERKAWAARASAADLLGASRWSRRFAGEVLGVAATAPPVRTERVSDLAGALDTVRYQYGGRFRELLALLGGDLEAFALELLRSENGDVVQEAGAA